MRTNPKPTQEELEKMFTYFSEPDLIKTGKFYRFWSTGRITKHHFSFTEEVEPRIAEVNIIILPETQQIPNDSITTSFLKALELREILILECKAKKLLFENETQLPSSKIAVGSKCECCDQAITGVYYKAHIRFDGPARILCENCKQNYGFCQQPISSNNH